MGLDAVIEIHGIRNAQSLADLNTRIGSILHTQELNADYGNYFKFTENDVAEFQTMWRYWGPGYERGPWFDISGVLMTAMGMVGLEVRYDSDSNMDNPEIMTPQRLAEYWRHFCGPNGNDYRTAFHTAQSLLLNRRALPDSVMYYGDEQGNG
jgi:hypothetical protein